MPGALLSIPVGIVFTVNKKRIFVCYDVFGTPIAAVRDRRGWSGWVADGWKASDLTITATISRRGYNLVEELPKSEARIKQFPITQKALMKGAHPEEGDWTVVQTFVPLMKDAHPEEGDWTVVQT